MFRPCPLVWGFLGGAGSATGETGLDVLAISISKNRGLHTQVERSCCKSLARNFADRRIA